jgi:hypothetical protein
MIIISAERKSNWARFNQIDIDDNVNIFYLDEPFTFSFLSTSFNFSQYCTVKRQLITFDYMSETILFWLPSYDYIHFWWKDKQRYKTSAFFDRVWSRVYDLFISDIPSGRIFNSYSKCRIASNRFLAFQMLESFNVTVPAWCATNNILSLSATDDHANVLIKPLTDVKLINKRAHFENFRLSVKNDIPRLDAETEFPIFAVNWLDLEEEFRVYSFLDVTRVVNISNEMIYDGPLLSELQFLAARIKDIFSLQYVCIDIGLSSKLFVLDINPHGSWHLLRKNTARTIDKSFENMISIMAACDRPNTEILDN